MQLGNRVAAWIVCQGLRYPLSPPAHGVLQGGAFSSLLKQMAATAYSSLGTVTCQASICSLIRTSFAISGNCPLSVQKLCCQAPGAEPAGTPLALRFPGRLRSQVPSPAGRSGQGLVGWGLRGWASFCPQVLGEEGAVATGIHWAVWRRLSWLPSLPSKPDKKKY